MNKLSPIQLKKLSEKELDDHIDSLYDKLDELKATVDKHVWIGNYLKATVDKHVWIGNYRGVSSRVGIQATKELQELKDYIVVVNGLIGEKKPSYQPINSPEEASAVPENKNVSEESLPPQKKDLMIFRTFSEASGYAKANPGSVLQRASDGLSWVVRNSKR